MLSLFLQQYSFCFASLLSVSETSALRYLYSCVLGSVGAIDEELFGAFLSALNAMLRCDPDQTFLCSNS